MTTPNDGSSDSGASSRALTISEAAKECSLSRSTIRRFVTRERFPNAYRVNGSGRGAWRIPRTDLVAAGLIDKDGPVTGATPTTSPPVAEAAAAIPLGPGRDPDVLGAIQDLGTRLHNLEVQVARLHQRADVADTLSAGHGRAIEELSVDIDGYKPRRRERARPRGSTRSRWQLNLTFLTIVLIVAAGLYVFTRLGDDTLPTVKVPDVSSGNPPVTDVLDVPAESGLDTVVTFIESPDTVPGSVLRQSPEAGSRVEEGTDVTLFVSAGSGEVDVPDVAGETINDARERLWFNGLNVTEPVERVTSTEDAGTVVRTEPEAGVVLERGDTVSIFASDGNG